MLVENLNPGSPLDTLVASLGTGAFAGAMLSGLNAMSRVDHFSLVSLGGGDGAELVSSASLPGEHAMPSAQNAYIRRYHQIDPNRKALRRAPATIHANSRPACSTARLNRDQIGDSGYRHHCYVRPGLLDRFSIVVAEQGHLHCLNLYRYIDSGHFSASDIENLDRQASLFAAFAAKQCALVGAGSSRERDQRFRERIAQRLRIKGLGLSNREIEVVTRIVSGRTSEAIALDLGISLNTVLTYRKRAYEKAGISSQSGLFALCLGQNTH